MVRVEKDRVLLVASRHNPVTQRVDSQHIATTESGAALYPVSIRCA